MNQPQPLIMLPQDIIEMIKMVSATGKDIVLEDFKGRTFTTAALD